jgi:hypothetical protein
MDSCEVIYLSTLAPRTAVEEKYPAYTVMPTDRVTYLRSKPAEAKVYDFQAWAAERVPK